jgi:hypothetical protein
MDIISNLVFLICELWLDLKGMCAKVISLRLQEVGWEILCSIAIEPRQRRAERRGWDAEEGGLGDDVSPAWLRLVDGFVEEVGEQQVFEIWVGAVSLGDVLEEDGTDDAAAAPHEGDGWLVELPLVFPCGL